MDLKCDMRAIKRKSNVSHDDSIDSIDKEAVKKCEETSG